MAQLLALLGLAAVGFVAVANGVVAGLRSLFNSGMMTTMAPVAPV